MESLITVLMKRDNLTKEEAKEQVEEVKEEFYFRLDNDRNPYSALADLVGLKPNYFEELF